MQIKTNKTMETKIVLSMRLFSNDREKWPSPIKVKIITQPNFQSLDENIQFEYLMKRIGIMVSSKASKYFNNDFIIEHIFYSKNKELLEKNIYFFEDGLIESERKTISVVSPQIGLKINPYKGKKLLEKLFYINGQKSNLIVVAYYPFDNNDIDAIKKLTDFLIDGIGNEANLKLIKNESNNQKNNKKSH